MSNRLEECKVGGVVEAGRRAEAKPHKECFSFALGNPGFQSKRKGSIECQRSGQL